MAPPAHSVRYGKLVLVGVVENLEGMGGREREKEWELGGWAGLVDLLPLFAPLGKVGFGNWEGERVRDCLLQGREGTGGWVWSPPPPSHRGRSTCNLLGFED